jgi:hypothetical protein
MIIHSGRYAMIGKASLAIFSIFPRPEGIVAVLFADLEKSLTTILGVDCCNAEVRIALDFAHSGGFDGPVIWVFVLNYA